MLALDEYRRMLCPCGCGHLVEVSQAPENEGRFDVHMARCHARTAIAIEANRKAEHSEALMYRAELRQEV
jgi:hypothetical protein